MSIQNIPKVAEVRAVLETALELLKGLTLDSVDGAELVPLVNAVKSVAAFQVAANAQIELRAITNGIAVPGVAVKDTVVHRKWHDQKAAEELAQETFGDAAFDRTLKSPAQLEKLPGGDTFVAVAAYKPEAGKKVVY